MDDQQNENQETLNGLRASPAPASLAARYDTLEEVGRGGMGVVYKARDRETGELVALKVLKPEIAADHKAMERFKNELRLARKITHKNVCRIHELLRFGDTVVISMEFVEGESLRHILGRTGVSLRKGIQVAQQIGAGLREAHAQGVIHRDLKPENVMLDRAGNVKIMDFGVARSVEGGLTQAGALVGTPAYMSPEQAEGKTADHRADIYALGLVLYEMFTGVAAFQGDTPFAVALKQIHETPPPPRELEPALPAHLEKAVLKCLEKNPAKRFQSVDELEAALAAKPEAKPALASGEAQEIVLPARLTLWQRSDSWLVGLALLGAAGFFYLFGNVYPYAAGQIGIMGEAASEKAQTLLQKIEPSARIVGSRSSFLQELVPGPLREGEWATMRYPQRVLSLGLWEANRRLRAQSRGWTLELEAERGQTGVMRLDADGNLVSFSLPRRAESLKDKMPAQEAVMGSANRYARELFGLEAEKLGPPEVRAEGGSLFLTWKVPGPQPESERRLALEFFAEGLRRASFYGSAPQKETTADSGESAAVRKSLSRWVRFTFTGFLAAGPLLISLGFFILVLSFVFGVRFEWNPSAVFAVLVSLFTGTGILISISRVGMGIMLLWGLLIGAVTLFLPIADYYLVRGLPSRVGSWLILLRDRLVPGVIQAPDVRDKLKARPAGLGIVRGCAMGACYLGVHTAVLGALGGGRLAGPSVGWLNIIGQFDRSLILYAISFTIAATIGAAWLMVGWPAALASRASQRGWVLVTVPTCLWLLSRFSLQGASAFPLFPDFLFAGLQGLFFSWVLYRYDFLTLLAAMFTVETWLIGYPAFLIVQQAEFLSSLLALLPWFLLFLLGLRLYLHPQLAAARRRVAAVFAE